MGLAWYKLVKPKTCSFGISVSFFKIFKLLSFSWTLWPHSLFVLQTLMLVCIEDTVGVCKVCKPMNATFPLLPSTKWTHLGMCSGKLLFNEDYVMQTTLYNFRLYNVFSSFLNVLSSWVKPRSITWFFHFLFKQDNDVRWIGMFKIIKLAIFILSNSLRPCIKKNTKFRVAIYVVVQNAYILCKLKYAASCLLLKIVQHWSFWER
jgi:hypothetical protein